MLLAAWWLRTRRSGPTMPATRPQQRQAVGEYGTATAEPQDGQPWTVVRQLRPVSELDVLGEVRPRR
jgi:hypothetical protein